MVNGRRVLKCCSHDMPLLNAGSANGRCGLGDVGSAPMPDISVHLLFVFGTRIQAPKPKLHGNNVLLLKARLLCVYCRVGEGCASNL